MVSLLPGINMLMAFSVGLSVGYKRAFLFIIAGVLGIGIVSFVCAVGIGALIINFPKVFVILKTIGGFYVLYIAYKIFKQNASFSHIDGTHALSKKELITQGFITCTTNPKAWIFIATLLPPFLDKNDPINLKMAFIVGTIMLIELTSYSIYALGGAVFKIFMAKYTKIIKNISATLIALVGLWIIFE